MLCRPYSAFPRASQVSNSGVFFLSAFPGARHYTVQQVSNSGILFVVSPGARFTDADIEIQARSAHVRPLTNFIQLFALHVSNLTRTWRAAGLALIRAPLHFLSLSDLSVWSRFRTPAERPGWSTAPQLSLPRAKHYAVHVIPFTT
ncbi:hypothetical protein MVEN_00875500 [Mycena venus]|uniref:Uncharacterized protein n=1 Tax=Mycena venus TaxID=2733690 RepID=A0A8H6YHC1_9AGAR|nr:hypothetical protein MVEN_00875500 [Mycena venus]